ncbi:MAG TPA: hypothetical protein VMA30_17095 [Xanthobacteraceae bacterium]|nr:hypothetical protein [Xanthobacteraceae bacterium]
MPITMPWRAATKPAAQHKAAPAPQVTPTAVACLAVASLGTAIRVFNAGELSIVNHSHARFIRTTRD